MPSAVSMELPLLWLGEWPSECGNRAPDFLGSSIDMEAELRDPSNRWHPEVLANGDIRFSAEDGSAMEFAADYGWAPRERVEYAANGRGSRLQAFDFIECGGHWFPRNLRLTVFEAGVAATQMGLESPLLELDVEVLSWEPGVAEALVPAPEDVPGAYDQSSSDAADWKQLTPGGLDLLQTVSEDLAARLPSVVYHREALDRGSRGHRQRTLYVWLPVVAGLLLLLALKPQRGGIDGANGE